MLLIKPPAKDIIMNTLQAIDCLKANIIKDSETLATIKQAIESGDKRFDDEFLLVWKERIESYERGIKALNDNSGYVKCFYNSAYLVLDALNDDCICVIKS